MYIFLIFGGNTNHLIDINEVRQDAAKGMTGIADSGDGENDRLIDAVTECDNAEEV